MSIFDPKHEHEVNDLDGYFVIDPITRSITNTTEAKTALMQYDHNSEIFSFAIPRYVEDHDMTISDAVQIHYINSSDTEKQPGLYMVTDMRINDSGEEEMVVFSWIISQQAIALKGSLQFQIKFICYDSEGSGTPSYIWSTKVFSAINVLPGLNNAEVVVTEYPDILSQLSSELNRINDKINKLSVGGGSGGSGELNVQILDGVDLNSVHDTGIYKVWSNCDNLPDRFHAMEDPGVGMMIVTNDGGDGEYADAHQTLFAIGYDGESIVVQRIVQVHLKSPYDVYTYPWGAVTGGSGDLDSSDDSIYYTHVFENLANPDEIESGYINPTNGALLSHTTYKTTGYISVKPGDLVGMSINNSQNFNSPLYMNFVACYDVNKQVIKNALPSGNKAQFVVPENVYFVRVSYIDYTKPVSFEILNEMGHAPYYLNYGETLEYKVLRSELGIRFFLPERLYMYANSIFDIYYPAMFASTNTGYNIELSYQPVSSIATFSVTDRKITVTTKGAGSIPITINVANSKGERIASKRVLIIVKAKSTATKTIAPIGDSLTNNKNWLAEVIRLNNNFSFVGCKSGQAQDFEKVIRSFGHSGHSGWSAHTYHNSASNTSSGTSEINPFWDSSLNGETGGFSWAYYVANSLNGTTPDIVNFFLGMNDIEANIEERVGYIKNMIDDILNTSPDIKIILCAPQYRDYKYSAGTISDSYDFMVKMYNTFKDYSSINFIPLGLYHDSEYNYIDGTMTVNPRSEFTINAVTDVTHPQQAGYWQIADAIFSALSAI